MSAAFVDEAVAVGIDAVAGIAWVGVVIDVVVTELNPPDERRMGPIYPGVQDRDFGAPTAAPAVGFGQPKISGGGLRAVAL